MTHMGHKEYFSRSAKLPNGQSHADFTADVVAGIISGSGYPQLTSSGVRYMPITPPNGLAP
jgi:hypothetical protein